MEIPTLKTQMKVAELLHDQDPRCGGWNFVDCINRPGHVTSAAFFLAKLVPSISGEMFPVVRADERDKLAYHIRAELVCCDLAEQIGVARDSGQYPVHITNRDLAKLLGLSYHSICFYGGWAARLAAEGPEFDHRKSTFPQGCCEPGCKCRG